VSLDPTEGLEVGLDFRQPQYRQQVFLAFYLFHLKYRSHPGAVYYLLPYLREKYGWDDEAALWFAFINGNTQNPITSYLIHKRFPDPKQAPEMVDWFNAHHAQLSYDTDRRHHKKLFGSAVAGYLDLMGGSQINHWTDAAQAGFAGVWARATQIPSFGRLSAFSYGEYLRITGVPYDCDTLLLEDLSGSKSHRNGLAKVIGRDDLDWHSSNPDFNGQYTESDFNLLVQSGEQLLQLAKTYAKGSDYAYDVSYFTLESALCTYKSWHRVNRRYPNVYNDLLHDRIKKAEQIWPDEDLSVFWEARNHYLPKHLRLEDNPHDPGCKPIKQNHYRLTGQVVMMNHEYPVFDNDFNRAVDEGKLPLRKDK